MCILIQTTTIIQENALKYYQEYDISISKVILKLYYIWNNPIECKQLILFCDYHPDKKNDISAINKYIIVRHNHK